MAAQKMLIVIGGPTASGKTSLAIQLAKHFETEILSADSRQFYKEMSIGTGKPFPDELAQAPHHFIGHLSVTDPYSAGQFEMDAMRLIEYLFKTKDHLILVGGSGLFLKAVTEGLDEFPDIDEGIREALNEAYREKGLSYLQQSLEEVDPAYYQLVDKENPRRLIRALEVFHSSGKSIRYFQQETKKIRPFKTVYLQPHWSRDELYSRIDKRVSIMFANGLVEEVKSLEKYRSLQSLQTVGYQEVFEYLDGKTSIKEAKAKMQQSSRRYAKRQLTWARQRGQWVLMQSAFLPYAIHFIKLMEAGWNWKIQQLTPAPNNGHAEEKYSTIGLYAQGEKAEILIAKRPKIMRAYWNVAASIPADVQVFLLEQLVMRADRFDLMLWSNTSEALILQKKFIPYEHQFHFPFDNWVANKEHHQLFKLKR